MADLVSKRMTVITVNIKQPFYLFAGPRVRAVALLPRGFQQSTEVALALAASFMLHNHCAAHSVGVWLSAE